MIRRHFIRSIASLAALSAVPGVVRARPTPFALANFADVRPDGIVVRQKHFRLAQPALPRFDRDAICSPCCDARRRKAQKRTWKRLNESLGTALA